MQNVIALILFTYPGAVCEYVYRRLSEDRAFFHEADEVFRVARDFFLSVAVTAICLWISGAGTLTTLMKKIQDAPGLFMYAGCSLLVSVAVGIIWHLASRARFRVWNRVRKSSGKAVLGPRKTVWQDFLSDPDIQSENVIAAVYRDGKLLRAGILWEKPMDLETDKGMILTFTSTVEGDLRRKRGRRALIGDPIAHYIDMESGTDVALYDGNPMLDYISRRQDASASAEAPVEARQASEDAAG